METDTMSTDREEKKIFLEPERAALRCGIDRAN